MLRTYKYYVEPTRDQEEKLAQHFGATRFVYNWGLERKVKAYTTCKKTLSCFALCLELTQLKKEIGYEWLQTVQAQSLQKALRRLDNAFYRFFKKQNKFPKFKTRKYSRQSFQYPQNVKINFNKKIIYLPKIGEVKCLFHREFVGKIKTVTVSKTATGKYFVSILVDNGKGLPKKKKIRADSTIGLDVGIKNFVTTSDGEVFENPKHLENNLKRLAVKQRQFSKKKRGSNNREQARLEVAKVYERVSNLRNDFSQKLSFQLMSENQTIAIEDLNVKGLIEKKQLSRAISDASWSKFFEFLEYKTEWYGKNLIKIGRFKASSQICSVCGFKNAKLKLSDRKWVCKDCKTIHDRDKNAATNIKNFALIQVGVKGLAPTINKSL